MRAGWLRRVSWATLNRAFQPTFARFRRFRGQDHGVGRFGQRQLAIMASKGRWRLAVGRPPTKASPCCWWRMTAKARTRRLISGRRNGRFRRVSPIPVCPGEGRLTQSTADFQPEKRELALVPQRRAFLRPERKSMPNCNCRERHPAGQQHGLLPVPALMLLLRKAVAKELKPRRSPRAPARGLPWGPVLKSAPRDDGRAYQIVLLFERPVVGKPAEQNNVFDPPAWPDASRCMLMEITPL